MTPARLVRVLGDVLEVLDAFNAARGKGTWSMIRGRGMGKGMKVKEGQRRRHTNLCQGEASFLDENYKPLVLGLVLDLGFGISKQNRKWLDMWSCTRP